MNPLIDSSAAFGLTYFAAAAVLGAALGLMWTSFSLFALVCGLKTAGRFVLDLLFFAVCGLSVFLFVISANAGMVRGYILLGAAMGFIGYRCTLGRIFARFFTVIERFVQRVAAKARRQTAERLKKLRLWVKKTFKIPPKKQKTQKKHLPDVEIS